MRYLKIGEESKFSEEAETYQETLDPETADLDSEDDDKLVYEGISGVDRIAQLGTYSTSGSITIPIDDEATAWFWKWALGGYDVEGDEATSFTHIFRPERTATMPSFSAKIGKDIFEHIFLGNVIESIEVEMDSEWALMTVNTLGAKDKRGTMDNEPQFTEGNLFTAPMASLTKNNEDISAKVNSLSMSLETNANVEDSAGFGSRFPTKPMRGGFLVTLELTLGFDDMEELEAFWGNIDGPSTSNIDEFEYTLSLGSNIDFIFPRLVYTASNQPVEGRDYIEQTVTARALFDDENQTGPISVSITNNKDSYRV